MFHTATKMQYKRGAKEFRLKSVSLLVQPDLDFVILLCTEPVSPNRISYKYQWSLNICSFLLLLFYFLNARIQRKYQRSNHYDRDALLSLLQKLGQCPSYVIHWWCCQCGINITWKKCAKSKVRLKRVLARAPARVCVHGQVWFIGKRSKNVSVSFSYRQKQRKNNNNNKNSNRAAAPNIENVSLSRGSYSLGLNSHTCMPGYHI